MWQTEYGLVCLWDAYVSPTERLRRIHLFWTAGRFFTIWATMKAPIHVKKESNPLPGFVFHLGYGVLAALYWTVYDSGENPSMQDINCRNPSWGYQQGILFQLSTRWLNIGLSVKLSGIKEEKRGDFAKGNLALSSYIRPAFILQAKGKELPVSQSARWLVLCGYWAESLCLTERCASDVGSKCIFTGNDGHPPVSLSLCELSVGAHTGPTWPEPGHLGRRGWGSSPWESALLFVLCVPFASLVARFSFLWGGGNAGSEEENLEVWKTHFSFWVLDPGLIFSLLSDLHWRTCGILNPSMYCFCENVRGQEVLVMNDKEILKSLSKNAICKSYQNTSLKMEI